MIPILNIRLVPLLVRWHLYIEMAPWYHWIAIAYWYQLSLWDKADVKSWLQGSDTSWMPPINVVFFLCRASLTNTQLGNNAQLVKNSQQEAPLQSYKNIAEDKHNWTITKYNRLNSMHIFFIFYFILSFFMYCSISVYRKVLVFAHTSRLYQRLGFFWAFLLGNINTAPAHCQPDEPWLLCYDYKCRQQGLYSHIDGWVQDCSISSMLAMEILQSCIKPSIWLL